MTNHAVNDKHCLLKIFTSEAARFQHETLWKTLLKRAREQKLAGCTVIKGQSGFGPHRGLHTENIFEGAGEFTMILEIVDSEEKIDNFMQNIGSIASGAFVVQKGIRVRHHGGTRDNSAAKVSNGEKTAMINELTGNQTLLRIFVGESDKAGHQPLYMEILKQAKDLGVGGATVIKGVAGFGASSVIHEPHLLKLSSDLPVIIEIIDSRDKVHSVLNAIEPHLKGALVTEEEVQVRHYKAKVK